MPERGQPDLEMLMHEAERQFAIDVDPRDEIYFPEDSDVLRERQSMSRNGVVVVAIVVDRATGMLARKPEIRLHGFLAPSDVDGLWQDAAQNLLEALDQTWTLPEEEEALTHRAGDALGHYLYRRTRRRATVLPVVMSV